MSVTYRTIAKQKRVMCETTKRFKNAGDAQRFVDSAKNKGWTLRWYLCPICNGFHTTKRGTG